MRASLLAAGLAVSTLTACGLGGTGPTDSNSGTGGGTGTVTHKRVFVTSGAWNGNLKLSGGGTDGVTGADALCNTSAQAANLGGAWKAFIAPHGGRAEDRIADVGPWYLVNGKGPVFNNKANLSTAPLLVIGVAETGAINVSKRVWVGDGTLDCAGWASNDSTTQGGNGISSQTQSPQWRNSDASWCSNAQGLYCLEQ